MQHAALEFKHPIGTCLHEAERQATHETVFAGAPALLKFFRADSDAEASKLLTAVPASEPRLLEYGEAEVFDTHVVYVVAGLEQATAQPTYRRYAGIAIVGAAAAAALSLFLVRSAEHKAPPAVPPPAAVVQQQQVTEPPPVAAAKPAQSTTSKPRARHKRRKR